jgi:hypothetical protein
MRHVSCRVTIRTFIFSGVDGFQVRMFVGNVSFLLHAATYLFAAGPVESLFSINDEVVQLSARSSVSVRP